MVGNIHTYILYETGKVKESLGKKKERNITFVTTGPGNAFQVK